MTHGFANLVAHKILKSDAGSADTDLVATQYSGAKEGLRPVYDALIMAAKRCGDIEISPKKAYGSLRRLKQFAIIQPSTRTRVDVGLNMRGAPAKGRLAASGSFDLVVSRRVRLEKVADVNKEVAAWLKKAWSNV